MLDNGMPAVDANFVVGSEATLLEPQFKDSSMMVGDYSNRNGLTAEAGK